MGRKLKVYESQSYHRHFSKNSKSHKISDWASVCIKIVTIKGAWLLHCCIKFQYDISSRLWVIVVWKLGSRAYTHTHTHTSGCQLKIIFPDVLDHSEYLTLISRFSFFHENIAFSVRKQNVKNKILLGFDLEDVICANFHGYLSSASQNT